jgi:hypothetical protein
VPDAAVAVTGARQTATTTSPTSALIAWYFGRVRT